MQKKIIKKIKVQTKVSFLTEKVLTKVKHIQNEDFASNLLVTN